MSLIDTRQKIAMESNNNVIDEKTFYRRLSGAAHQLADTLHQCSDMPSCRLGVVAARGCMGCRHGLRLMYAVRDAHRACYADACLDETNKGESEAASVCMFCGRLRPASFVH